VNHTHVHWIDGPPYEPKCVEIDEHVCLQPINGGGEGIYTKNDDGTMSPVPQYFAGFIMGHDREGFEHRCEGFVAIDKVHHPEKHWEMTGTLEGGDLTLSPSILCVLGSATTEKCGFHGFVQNGKWVPA
jgi:hypothetical protein